MKITKTGMAGTLESSDVLITVEPNPEPGVNISLNSIVKRQYGKQIIKVVEETLGKLQVTDISVMLEDKGALDCTIRARLEAALYRAADATEYPWENLV